MSQPDVAALNRSASVGPRQSNRSAGKINIQENIRQRQLLCHSNPSWQVGETNEPQPLSRSILTKAGFMAAGGSVLRAEREKLKVKARDGDTAVAVVALSSCLVLPPSLLPSLRPSARREAQLSVAAGPHSVPLGLSSPLRSPGPTQGALACALHTSTHTHTHRAPQMERCMCQDLMQVKSPCLENQRRCVRG